MSLLQRLYEPQAGEILLDDVPLREYDIGFLRSRLVIVDQSTVLLNATIRDNVAYGTEATDEEVAGTGSLGPAGRTGIGRGHPWHLRLGSGENLDFRGMQ